MPAPPKTLQLESIPTVSERAGYTGLSLMQYTKLGGLWTGLRQTSNTKILIKASNIDLYLQEHANYKQGKIHIAPPDVLTEISIFKYLSRPKHSPPSIPKLVDAFKSELHYFRITDHERVGHSLFDFVLKAHQLIKKQKLEISEWHRVVRRIFKQMVECVDYMHRRNVCHFDLCLENFVINDIGITAKETASKDHVIQFQLDEQLHGDDQSVQIKLIDFAFAEHFDRLQDAMPFQSNKYCGKPHYMSPEMTSKKRVACFNAKAHDVWCLGVCLFMMCLGKVPYVHAKTDDSNFVHIMDGNLLFMLKRWNKLHFINPDIYEILEACLQYEAYRVSARDLLHAAWIEK